MKLEKTALVGYFLRYKIAKQSAIPASQNLPAVVSQRWRRVSCDVSSAAGGCGAVAVGLWLRLTRQQQGEPRAVWLRNPPRQPLGFNRAISGAAGRGGHYLPSVECLWWGGGLKPVSVLAEGASLGTLSETVFCLPGQSWGGRSPYLILIGLRPRWSFIESG